MKVQKQNLHGGSHLSRQATKLNLCSFSNKYSNPGYCPLQPKSKLSFKGQYLLRHTNPQNPLLNTHSLL